MEGVGEGGGRGRVLVRTALRGRAAHFAPRGPFRPARICNQRLHIRA